MVGSAICRALSANGFTNIVLRTSKELDLRRQEAVETFFAQEKPEYVFLAAAKVGGIYANNTYPAEFIYDNLQMESHIIDAAYKNKAKKLLFLGSSCIYPKFAPQPIPESALLEGALEPTNEWYAIAKIAGIKMCQAYRKQYGFDAISAMPTNLYGTGDMFHPENSHVIPALINRFHKAVQSGAPEVVIWGTGKAYREFLHVDDLAQACLFLMEHYSDAEHVNIGIGEDLTIMELAQLLAKVTGFTGEIKTNPEQPDGTPRKLLDVRKIHKLGWHASIPLEQGLAQTYAWYISQENVRS